MKMHLRWETLADTQDFLERPKDRAVHSCLGGGCKGNPGLLDPHLVKRVVKAQDGTSWALGWDAPLPSSLFLGQVVFAGIIRPSGVYRYLDLDQSHQ